ncbi:MAG: fatty acid oxidation complex subunit alpha FadB [Gammaproteobacteria bacterium]|nr:fatty acid oxidation complex subunit alpha FadB [Pseudomonadales bacterium]
MIFKGTALSIDRLPSGIASLVFDLEGSSVNKFNQQTLLELREAIAAVAGAEVEGLIFSSANPGFIVGADITEFTTLFQAPEQEILGWLREANALFNSIEDLPFPTVTALNGVALGGGMELAIATDYRVATATATLGFPEVKLGIIPGFGGTVRAPRLVGADNANQWISSGQHIGAEEAFAAGAVDAIVEPDRLIGAAESIIEQCKQGKLDYRAVRNRKTSPLLLRGAELMVAFETAKGMVAQQAGPNFPAPLAAVTTMQKAATMERAGALECEHASFVQMARTEVAANLVQLFLNDQYLGGKARKLSREAGAVRRAAVLGAGIMGGGIAYQSALRGVPITMKDIAQTGIDAGLAEARKLFAKRVARGRMSGEAMLDAMLAITPTLDYGGFDQVDLVVEAVVENPEVKKQVLAEVEQQVGADSVIATNTSTISVDSLAAALRRPENFCGMHFFNPVPVMPLVEVIRGERTSPAAIATVVAYARALGKTPIVVNDCPGFLVNRILFPYFAAFSLLLRDGADFQAVDRVMEKFGWPMGPAYLLDVIGMDTGVHAQAVMARGFPERMGLKFTSAMDVLYQHKRLGQKSGSGFYRYEADRSGKPRKLADTTASELVATVQEQQRQFTDQEIIDRLMLAMCLETVRCLEDGIVESPMEADMGLILGLGFPTFRGGALRYIDAMGAAEFCRLADQYRDLGALYEPTAGLREMATVGRKFYALPQAGQED